MAVNQRDFTNILDQSARLVPYWARSTNPIVRRHLGLNWRTVPPEIRPLAMILGIWLALFLIGWVVPFLLDMFLMMYLASVVAVPVLFGLYALVLVNVALSATRAMQQEISNNTFNLLRATPMSLDQIFLGKVAASIWRRMDDMVLITQLTAVFVPPVLFSLYASIWSYETQPLLVIAFVILGTAVSIVRVIVEPVMFGAMGVFIGLVTPARNLAITGTAMMGLFYIIISNLFARLPGVDGDPTWTFILHFIVPFALPLFIVWALMQLAKFIVTSD